MVNYSEQFLKETIRIWQPHYPEPLTLEDAREIADNTAELFLYLKALEEKYEPEKTDL